jgi:choline dehydrogenase-like flavoprotein
MAAEEVYDVIICGAGSGGGFLAGEIAPYGSVLILDAGPRVGGDPSFGYGSPERRRFSTQINLGQYQPDNTFSNRGTTFFAYPMYMIESNQINASVQREARVVGGGSFINVGAWVRPRLVDWDGFSDETQIEGWTKPLFERHFLKAEKILHVHRDRRENWQRASVLYEKAANSLGIPTHETASNRHRCIFCGHRLNAGMPCKYDALMSTAITQIPKALENGAKLVDNATVVRVEIENKRAVGITYRKERELITARARKLVVVSAGAIGTPLILRSSDVHLTNDNVGRYLRAHPGVPFDALLPGEDWDTDRGYQWNVAHFVMDKKNEPLDVLVHASASFPANTPWVSASVGFFGKSYKDLMRRFRQRAGAFLFELKPAVFGRVVGTVDAPEIIYPVVDKTGVLEPKILSDLVAGVKQVAEVYRQLGAIATFPNVDSPPDILNQTLTLFVTTSGALHPQGTCRAGKSSRNSVVDTNCMSHDIDGLMLCDASVIPNHISSNPNSMIMSIASRASEFVITEILGKTINPNNHVSLNQEPAKTEVNA